MYHPDATTDSPSHGEPDDRNLSFEELGQLMELGPERYLQAVTHLFLSGTATPAQWDALAAVLALQPGQVQLILHPQRFKDRRATQAEWQVLAEAVLTWSESSAGAVCAPIDRAVLAWSHGRAAHPG
jgi:hypothetical protein